VERAILRGRPDLVSSGWPRVSPNAKDFIKKCLTIDYEKRPQIKDLLRHPWIADDQTFEVSSDFEIKIQHSMN